MCQQNAISCIEHRLLKAQFDLGHETIRQELLAIVSYHSSEHVLCGENVVVAEGWDASLEPHSSFGMLDFYAGVGNFYAHVRFPPTGENSNPVIFLAYVSGQHITNRVLTGKHSFDVLEGTLAMNPRWVFCQKKRNWVGIYCILAQFGMAHNPLHGSDVMSKSVVTQCKTWLAITPTPTLTMVSVETLRVYTRDTVYAGVIPSLSNDAT